MPQCVAYYSHGDSGVERRCCPCVPCSVGRQLSAQSEGCRQQFEFPVESPQDLLVMSVFFTPSQGGNGSFRPPVC